jgi:hypothetical protein
MALFRLEAKIIARENRGRSVVAASAYRSGGKLQDERCDQVRDYTRRSKGIIQTVILRPAGAPEWTADPGQLWNRVEQSEKRKDAQLAREFILAMPIELDEKQQFCLAAGWAQKELVDEGMVAEISLHHPKDGKNPHVHILCTMRRFEGDQFSVKKVREWNDVTKLVAWRKSWGDAVNAALEEAGSDERVDHRSLKDQGIDRIPEPKKGVAATAMERKGIDTERSKLVRFVKSLNFVRTWMDSIQKNGEVHQEGMGKTWWERTLVFAKQTREVAREVRETVMDTWRSLQNVRFNRGPEIPPHDRDHGPER